MKNSLKMDISLWLYPKRKIKQKRDQTWSLRKKKILSPYWSSGKILNLSEHTEDEENKKTKDGRKSLITNLCDRPYRRHSITVLILMHVIFKRMPLATIKRPSTVKSMTLHPNIPQFPVQTPLKRCGYSQAFWRSLTHLQARYAKVNQPSHYPSKPRITLLIKTRSKCYSIIIKF